AGSAVSRAYLAAVDQEQIEELRRWGERLAADESHPELKPAGRAIVMLIAEIEQLRAASAEPPDRDDEPPPDEDEDEAPARRDERRWFHRVLRLAVPVAILAALVFATVALGPPNGAAIGPALLPSLKFSVGGSPAVLDRVRWRLDGSDVTSRALPSRGRLVFDASSLKDGPHTLKATVAG